MWTSEILNYFAGILDGEGSIGIEHLSPCKNRKKDYYVCRLTIINTSKILMDWLKENFKGTVDTRKQIEGRKTCYRWHVFGSDLEEILTAVIPFLKIKDQQAQVVLQYRQTVGKTGWNVSDETLELRKSYWIECKKLNKLGE